MYQISSTAYLYVLGSFNSQRIFHPAFHSKIASDPTQKQMQCLSSNPISQPKFLPTTHCHEQLNLQSKSTFNFLAKSSNFSAWLLNIKSIARIFMSIHNHQILVYGNDHLVGGCSNFLPSFMLQLSILILSSPILFKKLFKIN